MLDHLEIKTPRLSETVAFYARVLGPLGYRLAVDDAAKGFSDGSGLDFFLVEGEASGNVHYAFQASDRATVRACFDLGAGSTGAQSVAPALAPQIHPNYFAGYLRDPDGRLVEFVCHRAE